MNKAYRIAEYIQPWEIDDLERQIHKLIDSSYLLTGKEDRIILDVTLNVSDMLVNWNESKIPKQYFIDKFKYLETIASYHYAVNFDMDENIQGNTDKYRTIPDKEQDFIIWIDPNIFFSFLHLPYLVHASKLIADTYFVLSPQMIKYWDNSWDCITNKKYLHCPTDFRDSFDPSSLDTTFNNEPVTITENFPPKVTGWFSLFTTSLLRKIRLPAELGSYSPQDTYLALCCPIIHAKQYIMNNVVISDTGKKYARNYMKSLFCVNENKNCLRITDEKFRELIKDFYACNLLHSH